MDGPQSQDEPRPRRKHRLAMIVALVVTFGAAGAWASIMLPAKAIEQAKRRTFDCLYAIQDSARGDPADCRQSGAMLTLARTLPWTRDTARQEQSELEKVVLEHQLRVASIRDFDVGLRDRAGRALVDLHRGDYPPQRNTTGGFSPLADMGAHELMVELASPQDSPHDRNEAMRAALLLGDWEAAGHIARSSAAQHKKFALGAMIVACIIGDREAATMHGAEIDALVREHVDLGPSLDKLLIEQHCGLPHTSEPRDDETKVALTADPLGLIRARLSAAERLGDAVAVERWREREAALLERLHDDRAVALYRLF